MIELNCSSFIAPARWPKHVAIFECTSSPTRIRLSQIAVKGGHSDFVVVPGHQAGGECAGRPTHPPLCRLAVASEAQSGSSENTALGFMVASLTSPGDPGRAYLPRPRLRLLAEYRVSDVD
jgi:hypothetical protein